MSKEDDEWWGGRVLGGGGRGFLGSRVSTNMKNLKRSHICVLKTVAFADIIRIYKHICAFKTADCASGKVRGNSNRVSLSLLHFFALSSSRPINFSN